MLFNETAHFRVIWSLVESARYKYKLLLFFSIFLFSINLRETRQESRRSG